jgi:DNA (cytosine-5)-methyltransferase 1
MLHPLIHRDRLQKGMLMVKLACIDLFCGAGGLTNGLVAEGVPVVAGIDVDSACRHPFETNNGALFVKEDVFRVRPAALKKLFGDADVHILAGCPPCQPFSTYTQRYDSVDIRQWSLLYEFLRLIKGTRPDIVTMENVPAVHNDSIYHHFIASLKRLGYNVQDPIVDCSCYGLPQRRRRKVLLASRLGKIELVEPTHKTPTTLREAIGSCVPILAGISLRSDPLHAAQRLTKINLERIRASRPGGTWRDWPKHLISGCHRRKTGSTYPSVYGRMSWDEPAPTLTTQFYNFGGGRFGHPKQDRAITLREGAILQGFPEDYLFVEQGEPVCFKTIGRLIGNAVPVTLGRVIARSILRHLSLASDKTTKKSQK